MSLWQEVAASAFCLRYVQAGDIHTRYLEAGRGDQVLLFLHGSGGHLEAYQRNIVAHAAHFRVIALDMIGHGYSTKPDHPYTLDHYIKHILDVCDALKIDRPSISGESLGGWAAGRLAARHPDRVHKLVLNTAAGLVADKEISDRVIGLSREAARSPTPEAIRARLEWLMHDPSLVTDDLVESRLAVYRQPDFAMAMDHILHMMDYDNRKAALFTDAELASIEAETLVLWTSNDPGSTPATGQKFASTIPNARLAVMEGCGHWPQFEDAETFNRLHLEFLLG